jgi:predicted RNA-binding protein with PIN domain
LPIEVQKIRNPQSTIRNHRWWLHLNLKRHKVFAIFVSPVAAHMIGAGSIRPMYIIDGNNVIGGRVGWHRDKAGSRRLLMQDLARLARTKKLRLNVVFDGAPDPQFPDGSSFRGVGIFYSRYGADADTRIIEMVEAERNKKSLVVVTSDGKLAARARACGARVMRSGEFRRMLDEAVEKASDQEPEPNIKDDEMSAWLRYFGVEESDGS